MAYLRFLTYNDYLSAATHEHLKQLIREVPMRFEQAERRAEQNMREYLDQYYEIEMVFAVGKTIREYNPAVTYPAQVYIKKDDVIYRALTSINGYKKPTRKRYWKQIVELMNPCIYEKAQKYSQLKTYASHEIVRFGTEYWQCLIPHGYEMGEIHIPGAEAWKEVESVAWEPNMDYAQHAVVEYDGGFYTLMVENDSDATLPPDQNDCWGKIGDYSLDLEYSCEDGAFDYVVSDGAVFYPVLNPNADALAEGENISQDDPRNPNVVAHMVNLSLYYLHMLISPTNISETRRWAFEDTMQWLYNASKFKINPQIPRKKSREDGENKVDWALATFQKSYNPDENCWLI